MELWRPPSDQAQLHEWWLPLIAVSRRVREERIFWPVHIDEFALEGRIDRGPRPSIWVYVHGRSLQELLVDGDGHTYEFIHHRSGRSPGRFKELPLRHAIWRARLPDHVEAIWYDEPPSLPDLIGSPSQAPAPAATVGKAAVAARDHGAALAAPWSGGIDAELPQAGRGHLRLVVSTN